jgi:hypothetical protein
VEGVVVVDCASTVVVAHAQNRNRIAGTNMLKNM